MRTFILHVQTSYKNQKSFASRENVPRAIHRLNALMAPEQWTLLGVSEVDHLSLEELNMAGITLLSLESENISRDARAGQIAQVIETYVKSRIEIGEEWASALPAIIKRRLIRGE